MNPWVRKGLTYEVTLAYANGLTVTKRLDFLAYHLIKWIHGEQKLIEIAMAPPRIK